MALSCAVLACGCAFTEDFSKVDVLPGSSSCEAAPTAAPSCEALPKKCGPNRDESCCETLCVPGGTFLRSYDDSEYSDENYPATVGSFYLDKYEVTVARFRAFIASESYPPIDPSGAHPNEPESAWHAEWSLPSGPESNFKGHMLDFCTADSDVHFTWTDQPGEPLLEALPIMCTDWYMAFAFCIWDGGRLPSEAEWNYAAAGGDEQRVYPWSEPAADDTITAQHAGYGCEITTCVTGSTVLIPGSRLSTGDGGRWGHADLAGNLSEWVLDAQPWTLGDPPQENLDAEYKNPCDNCVDLTEYSAAPGSRVIRGGDFSSDADEVKASHHRAQVPTTLFYTGFRCARDIPIAPP